MIAIGERVQFDPMEHITGMGSESIKGNFVTGTIVFVHYAHRWFSVEYDCDGVKQRTSFLFSDVGKSVTICG